ncbi:hypothetical protein CMI37_07435 [Candidatus Pacearchaeota archaeon]|jgi:hypothetical protein|nr:hypothetical protein [Candidatus Pacearchaeota archaeon]|tara:strand:+ start:337 stop:678 length:342 start_codon:yes stop_codon:yes gene_type:complete
MAVNFGTIVSTGVVTVVGAKTALPVKVPDNCHTILIVNLSAADTVLCQQGVAGAGAIVPTTALIIPTNGSASVVCGTQTQRPRSIDTATSELVFDSTPGATTVYVTYVCGNTV